MLEKKKIAYLGILLVAALFLLAGCTPQNVAPRVPGLAADAVVTTFFDAVKNDRLAEAGQYVSPESLASHQVSRDLTGEDELSSLKGMNLLAVKKVTEQDNYAVVVTTLQQQDSMAMQVKPIGLEKINSEWYIVDMKKIYQQAKYQLLLKMLLSI
jgi:hypothetical protein